ncbi:hypothetical protein WUBG_02695 [Wuchereria bancrofti]|uniref:Uncharacterized protein n=1 Tax=Wuchereria bancrofti TaxID=6293 RepID=J9BGG0_WUCBA|nr:hypothetical protein WUBG_02695 [Wuchereria bancrofti]
MKGTTGAEVQPTWRKFWTWSVETDPEDDSFFCSICRSVLIAYQLPRPINDIALLSEIPHEKKASKKCDASAIHSSSQVNTKPNIPTEQLASRSRTQSSPNLLILTDHDD